MATRAPSAWARPELRRVGASVLILLCEYLALSYVFDAQIVKERGGLWVVIGTAGALGPLLVVVASALVLFAPGLNWTDASPRLRPVRPSGVAVHLGFAALFFGLTNEVFARGEPPPGSPAVWLSVWALAGVGSLASLLYAALGDLTWVLWLGVRAAGGAAAFGVLAWGAAQLSSALWEPLSSATFVGVAGLLRALGYQLHVDFVGRVLSLDGFSIAVAPVCSGIEGLGLYLVLMSGFLVQQRTRMRFPRAYVLLPIGLAVVWFGNVVRIALLMLVGARIDAEVAVGSFHSKAGWVFFCATAIGIAALARHSRFFAKPTVPAEDAPDGSAPWLIPLLVWVAASLALSALSGGHDPLYGVRVVVSGYALWHFRRAYGELWQRPSAAAWLTGLLAGLVWLVVPYRAPAAIPLPEYSDVAFYAWLAARLTGAVLVIPLCEELAFRGFFTRWLTQRNFTAVTHHAVTPLAIVLSSLAFGALHERWLLATLTGIAYSVLLRRSARLVDAVAAHAASNLVIAIWVLSTRSWQHW